MCVQEDLMLDTIMLRLRTSDGLDLAGFASEFGADAAEKCVPLVHHQIRIATDDFACCVPSKASSWAQEHVHQRVVL